MFSEPVMWMAWALKESAFDSVCEMVQRLSRSADANSAALSALYERGSIEGIHEIAAGLRTTGRITTESVCRMRDLWLEVQSGLESLCSASPADSSTTADDALYALHLFGAITLTNEGAVSLFLHPFASVRNFRRLIEFGGPQSIKHIQQIATVRGGDVSRHEADQLYQFRILEIQSRLRLHLDATTKEFARPSDRPRLRVDFLPTAADFYWAGIQHYKRRSPKGHAFTVFARTPGLFLPEDRHGPAYFRDVLGRDDLAQEGVENRARAPYFSAMLSSRSRGGLIYHFDRGVAAERYANTVSKLTPAERDKYDKHAFALLTAVLHDPGIGLVSIDRFPVEFNHLTLGNGRSVLVSARSGGRIGHGYWVHPAAGLSAARLLQQANWRGAVEAGIVTTASSILADNSSALIPELQKTGLTLLYAPLVYVLVRAAVWRPAGARSALEDFAIRMKAQASNTHVRVIKQLGKSSAAETVTSIEQLLTRP